MKYRLESKILWRIMATLKNTDEDFFGYKSKGGGYSINKEEMERSYHLLNRIISEYLEGDPYSIKATRIWPCLKRMDKITANLLQHIGLSPEACLVLHDYLCSHNESLRVLGEIHSDEPSSKSTGIWTRKFAWANSGSSSSWNVVIGDGIYWSSTGRLNFVFDSNAPRLPEALIPKLHGKPLSQLISHKIFDEMSLNIESVDYSDSGMIVKTNKIPEDFGVDEFKM
jgi:hypothetical protein